MTRKPSAIGWFVILFIVTAVLALLIPPNAVTLHTLSINSTVYRTLILALLLPVGVVWGLAFYSYGQLEAYADAVEDTPEGVPSRKLALGIKVLAWGLILPTILSTLLNLIELNTPNFTPARAIINHYAAVLVPVIAFTIIADAAQGFTGIVRTHRAQSVIRVLMFIFIVLGIFFIHAVVHNQTISDNPYYLPFYPLVLTIVAPYLYAWVMGLLAMYDLLLYARKVKGVLYRTGLHNLIGGLTAVILGSILSQYITAATTQKATFSIGAILLIVYVLLLVEGIGYLLVALGAQRLRKIEEV